VTPDDFHNVEAERTSGEFITFSFGRNWQKYLSRLDDTRLAHAQESLVESLGVPDLSGLTFIDAGCGSGIFSLSALRLGALRVTSVDIDPGSIECARRLRERETDKDRWVIRQGSLLRPEFIDALEPADVVYSWGVLHHTGAMWTAIDHSMRLVKPGGRLCLALYREPRRVKAHLALKRSYNQLPSAIRPILCGLYYGMLVARNSFAGRATPIRYVTEYGRNSRGMSLWRDVEDWLGGLPCEFATPEGVESFASDHGFDLEGTVIAPPGANSEYLLRAPGANHSPAGEPRGGRPSLPSAPLREP
jgi:SAM-dependent methyltransferase